MKLLNDQVYARVEVYDHVPNNAKFILHIFFIQLEIIYHHQLVVLTVYGFAQQTSSGHVYRISLFLRARTQIWVDREGHITLVISLELRTHRWLLMGVECSQFVGLLLCSFH